MQIDAEADVSPEVRTMPEGKRQLMVLASLVLALVCFPGWGQKKQIERTKTFTSTDHTFSFHYPATFKLCSAVTMDDCSTEAMLSGCEEDALVCVLYPNGSFPNTPFDGAGFQVRMVTGPNSPDTCATPETPQNEHYTRYLISAEHPMKRIGSVNFIHGINAQVAAGTVSSTDYYRAFHKERCYELSVTDSGTNPANFGPGTIGEFTAADARKVTSTLERMLQSFRFHQ